MRAADAAAFVNDNDLAGAIGAIVDDAPPLPESVVNLIADARRAAPLTQAPATR
jgi:hypothetical protein